MWANTIQADGGVRKLRQVAEYSIGGGVRWRSKETRPFFLAASGFQIPTSMAKRVDVTVRFLKYAVISIS